MKIHSDTVWKKKMAVLQKPIIKQGISWSDREFKIVIMKKFKLQENSERQFSELRNKSNELINKKNILPGRFKS